jgi:hypothetical protein
VNVLNKGDAVVKAQVCGHAPCVFISRNKGGGRQSTTYPARPTSISPNHTTTPLFLPPCPPSQSTTHGTDNTHKQTKKVLSGGRGLGTFKNGFKGGVHLATNLAEVKRLTENMLGQRLVTKQSVRVFLVFFD